MPTARETFHTITGRTVRAGDVLDASDPIINGREALFTFDDAPVEAATAAPGEKRARKPRGTTKKAAAGPVEAESGDGA